MTEEIKKLHTGADRVETCNKIAKDFAEKHFAELEFLDELRASGDTNMYGARPYLIDEFDLDKKTVAAILTYWMKSFSERHRQTTASPE